MAEAAPEDPPNDGAPRDDGAAVAAAGEAVSDGGSSDGGSSVGGSSDGGSSDGGSDGSTAPTADADAEAAALAATDAAAREAAPEASEDRSDESVGEAAGVVGEAAEEAATTVPGDTESPIVVSEPPPAEDASPPRPPTTEPPGAPDATDKPRTRYRLQTSEGQQVIISGNAPNVRLHVERGLTVDARGRKRFGPQTIFLDGVYAGAPFTDNEARHYSLDHHAGCVRAFTLSTCEQAVVMLLQGLPLSAGMWDVYVNDPDLDSMLAAWVLLNHVELLRNDRELLRDVMPVIRLEGVIDAHGTEREILTGFPPDMHDDVKLRVNRLMARERELKSQGAWLATSWVDYARDALDAMDTEMYTGAALSDLLDTQESGRACLHNGRIAVLLDSNAGIYEVESRLKDRYGSDLGVIILRTGPDRYTLRLCDAFLPRDLNAVYKALNRADPKAQSGGSKPSLWGGSGDIGGSPRAEGTGLREHEILAIVERVLGVQPAWHKRVWDAVIKLFKPAPPALPPGD